MMAVDLLKHRYFCLFDGLCLDISLNPIFDKKQFHIREDTNKQKAATLISITAIAPATNAQYRVLLLSCNC
jgi:hypothetical protein